MTFESICPLSKFGTFLIFAVNALREVRIDEAFCIIWTWIWKKKSQHEWDSHINHNKLCYWYFSQSVYNFL